MTDTALAGQANIDPRTLSHYRSGRSRPRPETVVAIAFALGCNPIEIDPSIEDEFKRNASWFIEATSETRALFAEWSALSNEIQQQRSDLVTTFKTLQQHCLFIESQIQENQVRVELIERQMSAKMAEMARRQRLLEAMAGQHSKRSPNLGLA